VVQILLVKRDGRDDFTSLRLTVHGRHARWEFGTLGRAGNDLLWWWIVSNSFISDGNNMKMDAEQVTAPTDRADSKGVRVSII
jgi:hypothetical protein